MSRKHQLRKRRVGAVINLTSTKQESTVMKDIAERSVLYCFSKWRDE